jgi:hypothetical protein
MWIEIRPALPAWNPAWAVVLAQTWQPYRLAYAAGKLSDETASYVLAHAAATALVVGWSRPEPVDPDGVEAFLLAHPFVLEQVMQRAYDHAIFTGESDGSSRSGGGDAVSDPG